MQKSEVILYTEENSLLHKEFSLVFPELRIKTNPNFSSLLHNAGDLLLHNMYNILAVGQRTGVPRIILAQSLKIDALNGFPFYSEGFGEIVEFAAKPENVVSALNQKVKRDKMGGTTALCGFVIGFLVDEFVMFKDWSRVCYVSTEYKPSGSLIEQYDDILLDGIIPWSSESLQESHPRIQVLREFKRCIKDLGILS